MPSSPDAGVGMVARLLVCVGGIREAGEGGGGVGRGTHPSGLGPVSSAGGGAERGEYRRF
jgi:hypothetical protein